MANEATSVKLFLHSGYVYHPSNPLPSPSHFRIHTEKNNSRQLVPVRPVAVLAGGVSLESKKVLQLI